VLILFREILNLFWEYLCLTGVCKEICNHFEERFALASGSGFNLGSSPILADEKWHHGFQFATLF